MYSPFGSSPGPAARPPARAPMEIRFDSNPLADLVGPDVYSVLAQHNLLNEKGVRDYQIRHQFRTLREHNVPAYEAIEELREQHPYLQFDTIRKIVYGLRRRS